jgi:hypothetical protein
MSAYQFILLFLPVSVNEKPFEKNFLSDYISWPMSADIKWLEFCEKIIKTSFICVPMFLM